ncbi:hypothetical protein [Tsukamurella soli]
MIRQIVSADHVQVKGADLAVPAQVTIDLSGTGANQDLFRAGRLQPVAEDVGAASWLAILVGAVAAVLALIAGRRRGFVLMFLGLGAALAAGVTWVLCVAAPSYAAHRGGGGLNMTVLKAAIDQVTHSIGPWVGTEAAIGGAAALLGLMFGVLGMLAGRRRRREGW